jgi:hypothetical protein
MALFDDHGGEGERAFFLARSYYDPPPRGHWSLVKCLFSAVEVCEEIV